MDDNRPHSRAGQETTPRIVISLKDLKVSTINSSLPSLPNLRGRGRGSRGFRRGRGFRGGRGSRSSGDRDNEDIVEKGEEEDFLEEHVILKVPPPLAQDIREHIKDKEKIQDISLVFTDPRCGTFTFKDKKYDTKLVDLPTIIESQKIFNNKQMVKIADISQMLIVESPLNQPSRQTKQLLSYVWPDGVTPPLKDVRRRRFRKRVSKQIIEIVENELERLLLKDLQALDVVYEYADAPDREDSDSDNDNDADGANQSSGPKRGKNQKDVETPGGEELITEADFENCSENELLTLEELERAIEIRDPDEQPDEDEEDEGEGDGAGDGDNEGDNEGMEDDDEDADDSEDSDSDVDEEVLEQKAVLKEGILELETNLQKKRADLAVATNPIIKKRFEDIISKLNLELELKQAQLEALDNP